MSGIEIAGLVLGGFPLLLSGLQFYSSQAGKIRMLWRPARALRRLLTDVRLESVTLQNNIEMLFQYSVDEQLLAELREGRRWDDSAVQEVLEARLGREDNVRSFVEVLGLMNDDLLFLCERLRVGDRDAEGKLAVRWAEIKVVLSMSDLNEALARVDRHNRKLESLVRSKQFVSATAIGFASKQYTAVRSHAMRLYYTVCRRLSEPNCNCSEDNKPHHASLQLEVRSNDAVKREKQPRFTVLFYRKADSIMPGLAMQFEPTEEERSAPAPTALRSDSNEHPTPSTAQPAVPKSAMRKGGKRPKKAVIFNTAEEPQPEPALDFTIASDVSVISNFCSLIHTSVSSPRLAPSILLLDGYKITTLEAFYPSSSAYLPQTILLSSLLFPGHVSKRDRLGLAVQLASSIIQLYQTEWLDESWGSNDISFLLRRKFFRCSGTVTEGEEPIIARPLVRRVPKPLPPAPPRADKEFELVECNRTIYSLGIVLAELALQKRWEKMESEIRMFTEIGTKVGGEYSDAVYQCLCGLSMGRGAGGLGDHKFKQRFYEKVVEPLESVESKAREEGMWGEE